MWVMRNIVSVYLEIVLVSVQDRCMICAEHSIGSENVLNTHDGTARCLGHVESHFGLFADSGNLDARLVHGLR
jgi:hypothetical protein